MSARRIEGHRMVVADSLAAIFAAVGITLGSRIRLEPGKDVKVLCPVCEGGRTREMSLSLKVDADGMGATWHCKRGTCPGGALVPGSGRVASENREAWRDRDLGTAQRVSYQPAKSPERRASQKLYDFWLKRAITPATVDRFSVFLTTAWFPQSKTEKCAIAFPYCWDGEIVGHKYRSAEKEFAQDPGTRPTLFGIDNLIDEVGYFVEGEADVMAMWEAGFHAVSLRDGAPNKEVSEGDGRFSAFDTHAERLKAVKRWVIATDADAPGGFLAAEAIKRFGPKKCWRVKWPAGCKDANDTLKQFVPEGEVATPEQIEHGRQAVREAVLAASPHPLAGLVSPSAQNALAHRQNGRIVVGLETGLAALDEILKFPSEGGRLIVVTGPPNHGKSPFVRQVMVRLAAFHGIKAVFAAPEEGAAEVMIEYLTQLRSGAPFWSGPTPHMSDDDLAAAAEWVGRHFALIQSDDPDEPLSIEFAMEMAEAAKLRIGASYLVLDPWNEFEMLLKKGESETLMASRVLKGLKAWGRANGIDIVLIAHPQKPPGEERKNPRPPTGYDISGSANFYNKADIGITVWRPDNTDTSEIILWKSKSLVWGKRGSKALLAYDIVTGRYRSVDAATRDYMPPNDEF